MHFSDDIYNVTNPAVKAILSGRTENTTGFASEEQRLLDGGIYDLRITVMDIFRNPVAYTDISSITIEYDYHTEPLSIIEPAIETGIVAPHIVKYEFPEVCYPDALKVEYAYIGPSQTQIDADLATLKAVCIDKCNLQGHYCCEVDDFGTGGHPSCLQSCIIRMRGLSANDCTSMCGTKKTGDSCAITLFDGAYTYNVCGADGANSACRRDHTVCYGDGESGCYAGCDIGEMFIDEFSPHVFHTVEALQTHGVAQEVMVSPADLFRQGDEVWYFVENGTENMTGEVIAHPDLQNVSSFKSPIRSYLQPISEYTMSISYQDKFLHPASVQTLNVTTDFSPPNALTHLAVSETFPNSLKISFRSGGDGGNQLIDFTSF